MGKEDELDKLLHDFGNTNIIEIPERVSTVLEEMEDFEKENPRMRNVTRTLGELLYSLVMNSNAKTILELGTSNGYSAVWLGLAAQKTGGKVITVENQNWKVDLAKENIEKAGLTDTVTVILGDAKEISKEIGEIDFLFMDIWTGDNLPCFNNLKPKLKTGSLFIVDNLSTHRDRDGKIYPRGSEGDDYLEYNNSIDIPNIKMDEIGSGIQIGLIT